MVIAKIQILWLYNNLKQALSYGSPSSHMITIFTSFLFVGHQQWNKSTYENMQDLLQLENFSQ